ncbi:MAG: hypothetical protein KDI33_13610 [Halioglobus sp.]|nr:hypothetical protein [Halioglobus sp.]
MEELEERKSRARRVVSAMIWAVLIGYFAYSNGYLEKFAFDDGKRVAADVLIRAVDAFGLSSSTLRVQVEAGKLYFFAGENETAVTVLEATLPLIAEFDNVEQRHYASVYFVLGEITAQSAQFKRSVDFLLQGLRLEPQNLHYQLYLGDVYTRAGKHRLATEHYTELLEVPNLKPEQRAILKIGIAEGGGEDPSAVEAGRKLAEMPYLDYPLLTLVPINNLPETVALQDLCLVLESVFQMGCVIERPLKSSAKPSSGRNQIDAVDVIDELETTYPREGFAPIVGIMADDIYSGTARFVFSTQALDTGYGVVSISRFFRAGLNVYANEKVYNRRLAIQLISVVGQLLGFPRPAKPHCPLAYPDSMQEFLLKQATLCPSTRRSLKALLTQIAAQDGVQFSRISKSKIDEMLRIKAKYGLEG